MTKKKDEFEPNKEEMVGEETVEETVTEAAAEETVKEPETAEEAEEKDERDEKIRELEDKIIRQLAEFDNFRKRTAKEKEEIGLVAKTKCIAELLPVLDNFERAMQAESADEEFKKGVGLIFTSFIETLKKLGVEEIAAEGEPFNPERHYAVTTVEDENLGSNVVASVLQKGYHIGDRVVRHAMVAVANP